MRKTSARYSEPTRANLRRLAFTESEALQRVFNWIPSTLLGKILPSLRCCGCQGSHRAHKSRSLFRGQAWVGLDAHSVGRQRLELLEPGVSSGGVEGVHERGRRAAQAYEKCYALADEGLDGRRLGGIKAMPDSSSFHAIAPCVDEGPSNSLAEMGEARAALAVQARRRRSPLLGAKRTVHEYRKDRVRHLTQQGSDNEVHQRSILDIAVLPETPSQERGRRRLDRHPLERKQD